jgi:hypothetical protein
MSSVIVAGDTSGSVTLQAPAVSGSTVLTLPTTSGTLVVNSGAQTIEFADGSASAPSITNSGDTNTGMFFPAADTIAFAEGGTESMRIDSSGNLIVGGTGAYLPASGRGNITLNGTSSALYTLSVNSTGVGYVGASSSSVELATTGAIPILFTTNNAERMRLDSSGALGLGVTPNAWSTSYKAFQFGKTGVLWAAASANDFYLGNNNYYDGANLRYISNGFASEYYQASGVHAWRTAASGIAGNTVSMTQAMTLNATGDLLIGTTDRGDTTGNGIKMWENGGIPRLSMVGNTTSTGQYPIMIRASSNNTWRMYIDWGGNIYAQNTAITSLSDIRLKENIRDLETGLDAILALKPRRFDWQEGKGQDKKDVAGFIAQEFEEILPEMVTTGMDEDESGDKYKMLAPSMLIPTLVKAIQELKAIVDTQAEQIKALQGVK